MAIKEWTTIYPTGLDAYAQMPTLVNGADRARVSQIQSLRDAVMNIEQIIGSNSIEAGSIRFRVGELENIMPSSGSGVPATTPLVIGQIYVDTSGPDVYVSTGTSSSSDWLKIFDT